MKSYLFILLVASQAISGQLMAMNCPLPPTDDNPVVLPEPWQPFPFSAHPQYEKGISFVNVQIPPKAISTANGVICTYRSPNFGNYSIWQQKIAKKAVSGGGPSCPTCYDYWFSDKRRGDTCSESIEKCSFLILNTGE